MPDVDRESPSFLDSAKAAIDSAKAAVSDALEGLVEALGTLLPEPEPQLIPVRVRRPPARRRR